MKKLFLALCVCAGLCACSSDDDLISSSSVDTAEGSVAYLTVNLKDVNSSTRAESGGFAYGTAKEQFVTTAHFYFYDENGNYMAKGSIITNGNINNGRDGITGTANNAEPVENIEWESNTVVAVYGLELDDKHSLPTKMLTILNQPDDFDPIHMTLDEATSALSAAKDGYAYSKVSFVMSTSVYTDNGAIINYTALDPEKNFAPEPINLAADYGTSSEYKAVDVYVERLAAKVTANVGTLTNAVITTDGDTLYNITDYVKDEFANGAPEGGVYVKLEGFAVNGVARDAYMVKNISDYSSWSGLTFTWNGASNFRSYWAESPNYGKTDVTYPTSSLGNTNLNERSSDESLWLNPYLRYVTLKASDIDDTGNSILKDLGDAAYCGENTNTTTVLGDATSNGITNLLVKGQVYTTKDDQYVPLDLIEYHGMYFTVDDFLNKCVDDVVDYDFTVLVAEVIKALEANYEGLSSYLEELNDAIIHDAVYVSEAVTNHKVTSTNKPSSVSKFDGSLLSLYNENDGKVDLFFNGAEQYYGSDGTGSQVEPTLCGKYLASNIVYPAKPASLTNYEFYFHVDYDKLSTATQLGASLLSLIVQIDGEWYLPLDNSFYFTSSKTFDDPNWTGDHVYTLRNFFLRAITVEADGIDTEFGSIYPNYFKDGLMYYHVPIEHLGTTTDDTLVEGQYGIVRNHYYNITITSLENFGRGIADEDEVIVPQPDITYYYLGANINILSWKHITQGVDF